MHVRDFLQHETVRTLVGGGGQDGGEVEDFAECGVAEHVVAEVVCVEVADDLGEADLVVDNEEGLSLSC